MKPFLVYTAARIGLFLVVYLVLAGLWLLIIGHDAALWAPFVIAVFVSSILSLRLLARQRDAFAQRIEQRATRATAAYEKMRAHEDD